MWITPQISNKYINICTNLNASSFWLAEQLSLNYKRLFTLAEVVKLHSEDTKRKVLFKNLNKL